MKVLHFYKTSYPDSMGGVEQVIRHLAEGGRGHGIQTEVLSLSRAPWPPTVQMPGYRVHRAPLHLELASTGFSLAAPGRFAQLVRHVDVVHYHFPWPFMDLVHFMTRVKKPTVVTYHSDIIRQQRLLKLYRPLQSRFLRSVDHIVATSPNYLETSEVLGAHRGKVSVIPIGLDPANYPPPDEARVQAWRSRLGTRFMLFVGVLRYYKGLHILLEAAQGLPIPIAIVGAGPIEAELRQQAARLKLDNVHFLGLLPEDDKSALLHLCEATVFPSHLRSEAFGISLLEGALHGKPMISSEIGTGTTFINLHEDTGLVVPPSDPQALRSAMLRLWNEPGPAREMGRRARLRYLELFTAERMVGAYAQLYRSLLRHPGGNVPHPYPMQLP